MIGLVDKDTPRSTSKVYITSTYIYNNLSKFFENGDGYSGRYRGRRREKIEKNFLKIG